MNHIRKIECIVATEKCKIKLHLLKQYMKIIMNRGLTKTSWVEAVKYNNETYGTFLFFLHIFFF